MTDAHREGIERLTRNDAQILTTRARRNIFQWLRGVVPVEYHEDLFAELRFNLYPDAYKIRRQDHTICFYEVIDFHRFSDHRAAVYYDLFDILEGYDISCELYLCDRFGGQTLLVDGDLLPHFMLIATKQIQERQDRQRIKGGANEH